MWKWFPLCIVTVFCSAYGAGTSFPVNSIFNSQKSEQNEQYLLQLMAIEVSGRTCFDPHYLLLLDSVIYCDWFSSFSGILQFLIIILILIYGNMPNIGRYIDSTYMNLTAFFSFNTYAEFFQLPFQRKIADKVAESGFYAVVPDFFFGDPFVANTSRTVQEWLKTHGTVCTQLFSK